MAKAWVLIANLKGPKGDVGTFYQRALTSADNLYTLAPGTYAVRSGTVATDLGLPVSRLGYVIVPSLAGQARTITFKTNYFSADLPVEVFERGSNNAGEFTSAEPWREITDRNVRGLPPNYATDTWASKQYNGKWNIVPASVTAAGSTNPTAYAYELEHSTQPNAMTTQTARPSHANDPSIYYRAETATGSKVFGPWQKIATTSTAEINTSTVRHDLTFQDMAAIYGGKVKTNGAIPVALTFDDYPRDFRDKIKPLLASRNLPCTLGLSSRMYDPTSTIIYDGATGTTWSEIDAWDSTMIEIANHSATHGAAATEAEIRLQVVTGLSELRASLPSKKIYAWMQPSAVYGTGFNNGNTIEAWSTTLAGKLILDYHGIATAVRQVNGLTTVPCVGRPTQGLARNWLDTSSGITTAQATITAAVGRGHGLILGAHADRFGQSGMATMAELTTFLDWLVAEQTAGRIKMLRLSPWAVSDIG